MYVLVVDGARDVEHGLVVQLVVHTHVDQRLCRLLAAKRHGTSNRTTIDQDT